MDLGRIQHTFPLVTGVETIITPFTGKQQRLLTEQKNQSASDRNYLMLSSLLLKVGDDDLTAMDEDERKTFINNMLTCDKKLVLAEGRQLSTDFDPIYNFDFEYMSRDPEKGKQSSQQTVNIGEHFPSFPVKDFDYGMIKACKNLREMEVILKDLKPKVFSSYSEVLKYKHIEFTLLKTGVEVRIRMLDSVGESIGASKKKEQRSSHTMLLMRNVCYKSGSSYISFTESDLDKLPTTDLEQIRFIIKYVEGRVDTEVMFEHPEAELLPAHEKYVTIDLTTQLSFFFQSGTI